MLFIMKARSLETPGSRARSLYSFARARQCVASNMEHSCAGLTIRDGMNNFYAREGVSFQDTVSLNAAKSIARCEEPPSAETNNVRGAVRICGTHEANAAPTFAPARIRTIAN